MQRIKTVFIAVGRFGVPAASVNATRKNSRGRNWFSNNDPACYFLELSSQNYVVWKTIMYLGQIANI